MPQRPQHPKRTPAKRTAVIVVLLYIILGCAYIIGSDWLVNNQVGPEATASAQIVKGIGFIVITAFGLWALMSLFIRNVDQVIAERLQTDNALIAALDRFPGPVGIFSEDCHGTYFNSIALGLLKRSAEEAMAETCQILLPDNKVSGFHDKFEQALVSGEPTSGEVIYTRHDQQRFYVVTFVPTASLETSGRRIIVLATDISDRKHSAIRQSTQRRELRQIIDLIPNFVFAKDAEGRYIMANEAFAQFHGMKSAEVIGQTAAILLNHDEISDEIAAQDNEVIEQGVTVYRPCQAVTRADGITRFFQITKIPFQTPVDNHRAILCVAVDISEELLHQQEIHKSREQFSALVKHSLDALFVYDDSEVITLVNEKACKLVKMESSELVGANLSVILLGKSFENRPPAKLPFCQDGASFQVAIRGAAAEPVPVEVRVGALPGDAGRAFLAEVRDISERLRTERERMDLSRLGIGLSASRNAAEVARALFNAVCTRLQVDAFFCSIRISGRSRFRHKLTAGRINGTMVFRPDFDQVISADSPLFELYQGGPKLILREADAAPEFEPSSFQIPGPASKSLMFVPILSSDHTLALVSVQSHKLNAYTQDDLELVQKMVNMAAPAVESAQTARRGTIFARLGRHLGAAATAEEVAEHIADVADELTGWDCCVIALYSAEEDTLVYIYLSDIIDGKRQRMREPNYFKKPSGFSERVLNEGPFLILRDDPPNLENFSPLSRSPRPSLSMIWVPIPGEDGPTGFISLQSYAHQAYDDNDMETTWALAEHCGAALTRTSSQELLRYREERYRLAIESTGAAAYQIDYATHEYLFMGRQIHAITGYPAESFTAELWKDITLELQIDPTCARRTDETGRRSYRNWRAEMLIRRKDGEERWVSDQAVQVENALGNAVGTLGILRDITEQKRNEIALRTSEERYALSARGANDGLWDWNLTANTIHFSDRWGEMLGLTPGQMFDDPDKWFQRIHSQDLDCFKSLLQDHFKGLTQHFECEMRTMHQDGNHRWMLLRGVTVRDESGLATRIAGSQTDITDRVRTQERLQHDALHDPLTGLPNRAFLIDYMGRCLERMRRPGTYKFALVFMDLDRFKTINDSLGHLTGDNVLMVTAQRLKKVIRPNDIAARFAGDEFVLVLDDINSEEEVFEIVTRAQSAVAEPVTINHHEIITTSSAGIAIGSVDYASPEDVLRDADNALYKAKFAGSGQCRLFDTSMHEQAVKELHLEADLRRVIERKQLRLNFQPIINIRTGKLDRFEALIRWEHPERGMISPDQFITVAEETGLIYELDEWVMAEACRCWKRWRAELNSRGEKGDELRINLNLSPRHFMRPINLAQHFSDIIASHGVLPGVFGLELTETALLASRHETKTALQELKEAGFSLYLDDFGKGYSSLSYLHSFPFDVVKIDRLFVMRMQDEGPEREIVQAIVMLSERLNLRVVAEGVETATQMDLVRALGCDAAQGFHISLPVVPDEAIKLATMEW